MSETSYKIFLKHDKKRLNSQIIKLIELAFALESGENIPNNTDIENLLVKIKPSFENKQILELKNELIEISPTFSELSNDYGYLIIDGYLGAEQEDDMGAILYVFHSISPTIDARMHIRGDDEPWEMFYRIEDGIIAGEGFEPYNGLDEVAVRHGVYAWWHKDLPIEIAEGFLYEDTPRDITIECYQKCDSKLNGEKIKKNDWRNLKKLMLDSKVHIYDSFMESATDVRSSLNYVPYVGIATIENNIKYNTYEGAFLTILSDIEWLIRHDVILKSNLNKSLIWLLDSSTHSLSSGHNIKNKTGYFCIKGHDNMTLDFTQNSKYLNYDVIEKFLSIFNELTGLETLVASNVINPNTIKLVHFPKKVAKIMKELRVYEDFDTFKSRQENIDKITNKTLFNN
jgi:hypothetical protein